MNNRLLILIAALSSLLAACGSAAASTNVQSPAVARTSNSLVVEGKLQPVQSVQLSFGLSGEVAQVLVQEGDVVKAGDVIARLNSDTLQAAVAQAEAALALAKANQASLPQQIADAQAAVRAAQAQLATAAANRNSSADLIKAEAALAQAKYAQQQAETAHNKLLEFKKYGTVEETARLALETAIQNTQAAQIRVDQLQTGSPIDRAQGMQVAAASDSSEAAQSHLDDLQAQLDGKKVGPAAAAVQQAEAALQAAHVNLKQTELRAPIDGTVAKIDLKVGERVSPGALIAIIADFSAWELQTDDLTQLLIPNVKVGEKAAVKFDSLPELNLTGEVAWIGTVSQDKNGDVVYPVKIKLIDSDPRLRWGMTAAVTFEK